MKYQNGASFRRALEDRLRNLSLEIDEPLVRLRKMVAFDRFLARMLEIQPDLWVVKGGVALQLRLRDRARTTKDMDVLLVARTQDLHPSLKNAGMLDLGDWFSFEVALPVRDEAEDIGGVRFPIRALLDGRTFENFHLDVGIGNPMVDLADYLTTPPYLEFAEIAPVRVPCYPITQQIAEKLHAYTRPRSSGDPSRVKDFVDILLLAELGEINGDRLLQAIRATFQFSATHVIPGSIPPPPKNWVATFRRMSEEVLLKDISLDQAYAEIQVLLDPPLNGAIAGKRWYPSSRAWK